VAEEEKEKEEAGSHTPGKGHRRKSDPPKRRRFVNKADKKRKLKKNELKNGNRSRPERTLELMLDC
jgi:hypothetical protein